MSKGFPKSFSPRVGRLLVGFGKAVFTGIIFLVAAMQLTPRALGQTAPPNDAFNSAAQIEGTNAQASGDNTHATKEPGEPDHARVPGGKSLWWKWQAPATGYVTVSTLGSANSFSSEPMDTILAIYLGTSISNLMEVASNDDCPVDVTSQVSFKATAGMLYLIAVDGYSASGGADAEAGAIRVSLNFSFTVPQAPAWGPLADIQGGTCSSSDFAGNVVVLNFWATWCGPCVEEIPDLIKLHDSYASAGLRIIGVSLDGSPDGINPPLDLLRSFAMDLGITYSIVMSDPHDYKIESDYGGIPFIPATFIIDRGNHIVQKFVGSQSYVTFERAVLPALYDPPTLHLRTLNDLVHISWPASELPYTVETSDQLDGVVWTRVAVAAQSKDGEQFIDLPVANIPHFYRLRRQ